MTAFVIKGIRSGSDLLRIEQPSATPPVRTTILGGTIRYLGDETVEMAGRKWEARKFTLKVAL